MHKLVLRKLKKRINQLRPQRVAVKIIRPEETFNPESYRKQNNFIDSDVIVSIILDSD